MKNRFPLLDSAGGDFKLKLGLREGPTHLKAAGSILDALVASKIGTNCKLARHGSQIKEDGRPLKGCGGPLHVLCGLKGVIPAEN